MLARLRTRDDNRGRRSATSVRGRATRCARIRAPGALLLAQRVAAPPAADPADAMSFDVAPGELSTAVRELRRRSDDVPLRGLLRNAGARMRQALEQDRFRGERRAAAGVQCAFAKVVASHCCAGRDPRCACAPAAALGPRPRDGVVRPPQVGCETTAGRCLLRRELDPRRDDNAEPRELAAPRRRAAHAEGDIGSRS